MLNPLAYKEYIALTQKHWGYEPNVSEIKSQADSLVQLVQMISEKETKKENNNDKSS